MTGLLPGSLETKITFCGKVASEMSDLDFAAKAVEHLGLLESSAASTIADMMKTVLTEHPRAITTRYRKSGTQVSVETKRCLGLRTNAFLSTSAFDELSGGGKSRPLDAHEITLLRAAFHKSKFCTLHAASKTGFEKVRFSSSHPEQCDFCRVNDGALLDLSQMSRLPVSQCSREAYSALISPYRNFLAKQATP